MAKRKPDPTPAPAAEIHARPETWPGRFERRIEKVLQDLELDDLAPKDEVVVMHGLLKDIQELRKLIENDGSLAGSEIRRFTTAFHPQINGRETIPAPPDAEMLNDKSDADDASERP